jgi:hypothetical protein
MKKLSFIFFLLIVLSACSGHPHVTSQTKAKLDGLVGQHKREVIKAYGPVEQKASDENDGEIWIYYFYVERAGYATSHGAVAGAGSTKKMMFFINPSDTVYHWTVTGQSAPIERTTAIY